MHTIILMYHGINDAGAASSTLYSISERNFKDQMSYLVRSGYHVVPWTDMASSSAGQASRARVGLTFDDGNASDIGCARLLNDIGYSALFFIPTADLGTDERLTRNDVVELLRLGMGVGSHSHHHVELARLSAAKMRAS